MQDHEQEQMPQEPQQQTQPNYYYPQQRPNPYILPASILAAAVIIGGAIIFVVRSGSGAAAPLQNPIIPVAAAATSRDVVLGNANAPVLVVEYGDYQCPYCAQYFSQLQPVLKQQYIDTGKIRFVFRDFPFLGQESIDAGEAAECSKDQNKFWDYHNALYTAKVADEDAKAKLNQSAENDKFFTRAEFLKLAQQVGMNTTTFAQCLDTHKYLSAVQSDYTNGGNATVNSTPTTFVNGKKVVSLDSKGNPIPDPRTGGLQSVGADVQPNLAAIDAALAGK